MDDTALEGVTLAQYAGVAAALGDDLPLDAILAEERIDPPTWRAADAAWKARLAGDTPSGPTFAAYASKRAEAEDWLGRAVTPLDDDLGAWLAFLAAYAQHAAPFDLLAGAGMRLADVARLGRRWARRFGEDAALPKKAAEIRRKGAGPRPLITVGPTVLRPFPWSPGRAPAPVQEEAPGSAESFAEAAELPLDRYAAIRAELAQPGADAGKVVARYGLTRERFAVLDAAFRERLAKGGDLDRDYRRLFAYQRSRLRAAAKFVPRDPNAPLPSLTGTSLSLDTPRGAALPFVALEELEAIAELIDDEDVTDAEGVDDAEAVKDERPRAVGLAGTSLALDVPRGPALPFGAGGAPVAVASPPPPLSLAGTSLALDAPRGPATPFVEGPAPAEVAAPAKKEDAPAEGAAKGLGETSLAVGPPRKAPHPFAKAMMMDAPDYLRALQAAAALSETPALTLEQYASLCVELAEAPSRSGETLARYRLTQADREREDRAFEARFGREVGLREAWVRAMAAYRAWLLAQERR